MSKRNAAIGTILVLFTLVSTLTVFVAAYTVLQSINFTAIVAAIAVAFVGFVWFKKSTH